MYQANKKDNKTYKVVVNHEEQYSIWLDNLEIPLGWQDTGKSDRKQECLDYIEQMWTDMRSLSLRQEMADSAK